MIQVKSLTSFFLSTEFGQHIFRTLPHTGRGHALDLLSTRLVANRDVEPMACDGIVFPKRSRDTGVECVIIQVAARSAAARSVHGYRLIYSCLVSPFLGTHFSRTKTHKHETVF